MPGTDPKAYAIFKDGHRIAGAELASAFETETAVEATYTPEIDTQAIITPKLTSGESSTSLWSKVAKLFKNVRWLNAKYGNVTIKDSASNDKVIGDGTVSGTIGAIQDQMETISYSQYKAMKDAGSLDPNRYYFVEEGPNDDRFASSIKYSNAGTSLAATNVQTAINELNNKLDEKVGGGIKSGTFKYTPTWTQNANTKVYYDAANKNISIPGLGSPKSIMISVYSDHPLAWAGSRIIAQNGVLIRLALFSLYNYTDEITFQYIAVY